MKSSRHIKRWLKFVRRVRNSGVMTLDYIHTEKNLVDPLSRDATLHEKEHFSAAMIIFSGF
jgi:hypothetical protein